MLYVVFTKWIMCMNLPTQNRRNRKLKGKGKRKEDVKERV